MSATCSKIFQWLYCQLLKWLSQHWHESEETACRVKRLPAPSLTPDAPRFLSRFASLIGLVGFFGFYGPAQFFFLITFLITDTCCFHCEIPSLKYWSIWSNPSIKKWHADVKFLLLQCQCSSLHMRLVKERDQHLPKKHRVWDWYRDWEQWG